MLEKADDTLVFVDESAATESSHTEPPWKVLIVDDDPAVHVATGYSLANTRILDRKLELLHAHSAAEAIALLRGQNDIAVILLDVVMESPDAGLRMVDIIRKELGLDNVRIILRTGQPGYAPEMETITRYDINDYKTKSELSHTRLFAALTTAIRCYDQLLRRDATRRGMEQIVAASQELIAAPGLESFVNGIIPQLSALIGTEPEGLVCATPLESATGSGQSECRIIAATGRYSSLYQRRVSEIGDPEIVDSLGRALASRRSCIGERNITLYFPKSETDGFAAFVSSSRPLRDVDAHLLEVFCTNVALSAKIVELVATLRRDAFVDRLLGIPNRNAFVAEIDRRLAAPGAPGTHVALLDIDQFSETNDIMGYAYGDELLKVTAARLRSRFPDETVVARISDDVFGLVGDADNVTPETIRQCFAMPFAIEEIDHPVSITIGLTRMLDSHQSGVDCLKDGYIALKRAKADGLGQSVVFSRDIGDESRQHSRLLRDLRLAFEQDHLSLAYQPQVDLRSGLIVGVEALLRWRTADGTFVPPDQFIPIAERSGLIVPIGRRVLHQALQALKRLHDCGLTDLRMAVNVSALQLRHPEFPEMIDEALRETATSPRHLELEVTESATMGGIQALSSLLGRIKASGISISIDDFGTGYSSLSYLEKLPADRLKIDRSFVRALGSEGHGARIAKMIIPLGHQLGLEVIAEGVEHAAQTDLVRRLGCDLAQGFHFARPIPEADLIEWFKQRGGVKP